MVQHEIQIHAHAALMALPQEGLVILHRAELRIDRVIVIHVILVVRRRRMHRREPQRVKSEVPDVIELRADPVEVSDPVSVRIAEGIDEDLIGRAVSVVSFGPREVFVVINHLSRRGSGLAARCLFRSASRYAQQHAQDGTNGSLNVFHPFTAPDIPST